MYLYALTYLLLVYEKVIFEFFTFFVVYIFSTMQVVEEAGVVPEIQPVIDEPLAVAQPISNDATEIEFNVSPHQTPSREEKKVDLSRTSVHIPDFLELVSVRSAEYVRVCEVCEGCRACVEYVRL